MDFYESLEEGSLDALKEHLNKDNINSAFEYACEYGHLEIVKYLLTSPELTQHADIHVNNDYGFRKACHQGHFEIAEYLLTSPELKEHADMTSFSSDMLCVLNNAMNDGKTEFVKLLYPYWDVLCEGATKESYSSFHFDDAMDFLYTYIPNVHEEYVQPRLGVIQFFLTSINNEEMECLFHECGTYSMYEVISKFNPDEIGEIYDVHGGILFEKFTLEEGWPIHEHNSKKPENDELEIMI